MAAEKMVPARAARAGAELGARIPWPAPLRALGALATGWLCLVTALAAIGLVITKAAADTAVVSWDLSATSWLAEHRTPWLDGVTSAFSRSADTLGAIAVAVLISIVLAVRRRWWQVAVLVGGLALELLVFLTVNFIVDRPRPDVPRLGSTPTTSSFPSGHSAAAVVLYLSLAFFVTGISHRLWPKVLAWTMAVTIPIAVGFSRVYRGMHQPLDVLSGLMLGMLVAHVAVLAVAAGRAPHRDDVEETTAEPAAVHPVGAAR